MAYRIRELREKKKLTQEQLAQMSGVSRTTIVLLENNEEHEAMVGTLKSLAAALNVPVSKLFTQKFSQTNMKRIIHNELRHSKTNRLR